jgi:hypothetical protein
MNLVGCSIGGMKIRFAGAVAPVAGVVTLVGVELKLLSIQATFRFAVHM